MYSQSFLNKKSAKWIYYEKIPRVHFILLENKTLFIVAKSNK